MFAHRLPRSLKPPTTALHSPSQRMPYALHKPADSIPRNPLVVLQPKSAASFPSGFLDLAKRFLKFKFLAACDEQVAALFGFSVATML